MKKITLMASDIISILAYIAPNGKPHLPHHIEENKDADIIPVLEKAIAGKSGIDKIELEMDGDDVLLLSYMLKRTAGLLQDTALSIVMESVLA